MSQVVFLYHALLGRAHLPPADSAARILRALANLSGEPADTGEEDGVAPLEGLAPDYSHWTCEAIACRGCHEGRHVTAGGDCLLRQGRPARGATPRPTLVPVAAVDLRAGQAVATLRTERPPAIWLLVGRHWWPPPRAVTEAAASCQWDHGRCPTCGHWWAKLTTRRGLPAGAELTVATALTPNPDVANRPFEVFFDGSTRGHAEGRVAGAGAVLWRRHPHGPPTCIARAVLALPGESAAPRAEAHGCRLALELLTRASGRADLCCGGQGSRSSLCGRVIGDAGHVIGYAASQARFQTFDRREPVDEGLERALPHGWNLSWLTIRRDLNRSAHRLANAASLWATRGEALCGDRGLLVQWAGHDTPQSDGLAWPEWPQEPCENL